MITDRELTLASHLIVTSNNSFRSMSQMYHKRALQPFWSFYCIYRIINILKGQHTQPAARALEESDNDNFSPISSENDNHRLKVTEGTDGSDGDLVLWPSLTLQIFSRIQRATKQNTIASIKKKEKKTFRSSRSDMLYFFVRAQWKIWVLMYVDSVCKC